MRSFRLLTTVLLIAGGLALPNIAASAAHGGGEKKKGGGASFVQFPTLTASVTRPDGRRGVLTVEAGLDVPNEALRERAAASQPRLRDAYVRFLTTYAAAIPQGSPPSPDAIAMSLQRSTDEVLGRPGARMLLGTVMIN